MHDNGCTVEAKLTHWPIQSKKSFACEIYMEEISVKM